MTTTATATAPSPVTDGNEAAFPEFAYTTDPTLPATAFYGPGVRLVVAETGELLGFTRHMNPGQPGRRRYTVYNAAGSEVGIGGTRAEAARYLYTRTRQAAPAPSRIATRNAERAKAKSSAPVFRFVADPTLMEFVGYGPGQRIETATGELLGFVRRLSPGVPGRRTFVVYNAAGSEVGTSSTRTEAARYLNENRATRPTV